MNEWENFAELLLDKSGKVMDTKVAEMLKIMSKIASKNAAEIEQEGKDHFSFMKKLENDTLGDMN